MSVRGVKKMVRAEEKRYWKGGGVRGVKSQSGGVKSQGEEGQRGTELHGMNNTMQPQPDEKLGQKTMVQAQTGKVPEVGGMAAQSKCAE